MKDPYAAGAFTANPYALKRAITGQVVAVLRGRLEGRELELIQPISRVLARGDIHELIVTDEAGAGPGTGVDRIGYLVFFEVDQGGVAVSGDTVEVGGERLALAGFDITHAPNHLNVVVKGPDRRSGEERGIRPGDRVSIAGPG